MKGLQLHFNEEGKITNLSDFTIVELCSAMAHLVERLERSTNIIEILTLDIVFKQVDAYLKTKPEFHEILKQAEMLAQFPEFSAN